MGRLFFMSALMAVVGSAVGAVGAAADDEVVYEKPGLEIEFIGLTDLNDKALRDLVPLKPMPRLNKPRAKTTYNADDILVGFAKNAPDPVLIIGYDEHHVCGTSWYAVAAAKPNELTSLGCNEENPTVLSASNEKTELMGVWYHHTQTDTSLERKVFDGKNWSVAEKICGTFYPQFGGYVLKTCQ